MASKLTMVGALGLVMSLGSVARAQPADHVPAFHKQTLAHYSQSRTTRLWYLRTVAQIPRLDQKLIRGGLSPRERAFAIWSYRKRARLKARRMMADRALVREFEQRDRRVYGNPDGPSFEYLVRKARRRDLRGAAVFEEIISSSVDTSAETNAHYQVTLP